MSKSSSKITLASLPRSVTGHSIILIDDTTLAHGSLLGSKLAGDLSYGVKTPRSLVCVCGDRPVRTTVENVLGASLASDTNKPVVSALDWYTDPLGWQAGDGVDKKRKYTDLVTSYGSRELTVRVTSGVVSSESDTASTLSRVDQLVSSVLEAAPHTPNQLVIYLDCVSVINGYYGITGAIHLLQSLAEAERVHSVVALVHSDNLKELDVRQLTFDVRYQLKVLPALESSADDHPRYKLYMNKKSGRMAFEEGYFVCTTEGHVQATARKLEAATTSKGLVDVLAEGREDKTNDPTANLTFDLTLTQDQKQSKAKVQLSWQHTGDNPAAEIGEGNAKARGAVIYVEAEDSDIDSDDPDDDLDI